MTDGEQLILEQLKQILVSTDAGLVTLRAILEELKNLSAQVAFSRS